MNIFDNFGGSNGSLVIFSIYKSEHANLLNPVDLMK